MRTEPNDAAFARPTNNIHSTQADEIAQTGLSKREYFAAMALQGLSSNSFISEILVKSDKQGKIMGHKEEDIIAITATQYADSLIAELNKEQK